MCSVMYDANDNFIVDGAEAEALKAKKCQICTGCGCCRKVENRVHIITEKLIAEDTKPILSEHGERLVTVDIGTTTIAMQLHGTDGMVEDQFAVVNPQTVYGADVLSRIQASEKQENAEQLKQMVRSVLRDGIMRFQNRISERESLYMVIAANTTMVYLLMGWNTNELGRAPFTATHLESIRTELEGVPCYICPGLSSFVGGDIAAGILACKMTEQKEITLLIDLGTNGEMVLGNADKIIACSTAAGPAFEGGVNRGVWGADMVSLLATLRRKNILDETGLLADPYFDTGVHIGNVCVTQQAVRAIQLAKGAILAGIRILLREYGIQEEQIDRVVLAGGFGYYLNPQDAAKIGLLPKELVSKTVSGGNTALAGALRLGRHLLAGEDIVHYEIGRNENGQIMVINLADMSGFEKLYIESMGLE